MNKHTPGPLFVVQREKFPFEICIVDSDGNQVSCHYRYAYSSKSETIDDVMNGYGFHKDQRSAAIEANERQLADAYLRAAAPDLLEAAQLCRTWMYEHASNTDDNAFEKLCAAIAKATGDQS